jgi:NAD-dependent SIR2 family protein deacetylase
MALVKLHTEGYLSLVVSQNVDGLHLRSGLPRDALAELHGDCFAERCSECGGEFVRDFEMPSVGFKATGRRCAHPLVSSLTAAEKNQASSLPVPAAFVANGNPPHTELLGSAPPPPPPHHHPHPDHHHNYNDNDNDNSRRCNGPLLDQCLDWDDPLPPKELREAERRASAAAVALCLGTSLQIRPVGDLPLRTPRAGGALAIVNLQQTPKDKKAAVVCRARCDEAAAALLDALGLEAPAFRRHDRLLVSHRAAWEKKKSGGGSVSSSSCWSVELSIGSVHGPGAPLPPLMRRVEVVFEEEEDGGGGKRRAAAAPSSSFDLCSSAERTPLVVRRSGFRFSSPSSNDRPVTAVLRLTLVDEDHDGDKDGDRTIELRHAIAPPPLPASSSSAAPRPSRGAATLTFETQRVDYGARQRAVLEDLRRRAAEEAKAAPRKQEEPQPQKEQRRPRAPAAQQQRYGEREAEAALIFKEEEEEGEEDDDDGSDTEFVPSRACRAAAAATTTTATGGSRSSGSARASSSRPRKAAKLLDV